MTDIDHLEIEITSNATQAEKAIAKLENSLKALKAACQGGAGLNGVAKGVESLANAANSIGSDAGTKLSQIANAIAKISSAGYLGNTGLDKLAAAANGVNPASANAVAALANAVKPLASVGNVNLSGMATGLTDLGAAADLLQGKDFSALTMLAMSIAPLSTVSKANLSNMATGLMDVAVAADLLQGKDMTALKEMAAAIGNFKGLSLTKTFVTNFENLIKASDNIKPETAQNIEQWANALAQLGQVDLSALANNLTAINQNAPNGLMGGNLTSAINRSAPGILASFKMISGAIKTTWSAIGGFVNRSNQYIEDVNLFTASLGKYAGKAEEYAQKVSDVMGIDPGTWMRYQGVFQVLTEGFGVASDRAYTMSKNLTQLGYDISSFYNLNVKDAMLKLQSGLAGELEPLRRIGYDLSEARLKAIALSLGIKTAYKDMTQAEKSQLRYYAILTQVTTAQGDMARTLNAPANQLRVLSAQMDMAGRAIGNIFIPALNAVLPYAIAVTEAIRSIAEAIANLLGFQMPEVDYSGIEETTSAMETLEETTTGTGKAAKKAKELLADWDELNIIASESGSGSGTGSKKKPILDDWDFELPEYDFLGGAVSSRVDAIKKTLEPFVKWVKDSITWAKDNIDEIVRWAGVAGELLLGWALAKPFLKDFTKLKKWVGIIQKGFEAFAIAAGSVALNVLFTLDFLKTGSFASMFGAVAATTIGSTLFGKIVSSFFTGKELGAIAGTIATGVLFSINGIVSMSLALGDVEKEGLNDKNLATVAASALETTLGGYFIAKEITQLASGRALTTKGKLAIGAAALMISANVALGMALEKDALNNENKPMGERVLEVGESFFTQALTTVGTGLAVKNAFGDKAGWAITGLMLGVDAAMSMKLGAEDAAAEGFYADNIATIAKGALEAVGAGWVFGHLLFPGHEAAVAGAAAVISFGVGLNVWGSTNIADSTSETIEWGAWAAKILGDIVTVGGVSLIAGKALNMGAEGVGTIAGIALVINSAIGLATTFGKATAEGWTGETITSAVWDVVKAAVGAVLIAKMFFGLSNPIGLTILGVGILGIGIGATLLVALNNMKVNADKDLSVSWGESELTEEQVKQKVYSYFSYDVPAHINSITIADTTEAVDTVNTDISKIQSLITGINIGLDKAQSYANIRDALIGADGAMGKGTLIGDMKKLIGDNSITITDFIKLGGPMEGEEGSNLASLILGIDETLQGELTWAGTRWGELFGDGFTTEVESQLNDLLTYILTISNAATHGKRQAEFMSTFGNIGIGDMTPKSALATVTQFGETSNTFLQKYIQDEDDFFASMMSDYAALDAMIQNWQLAHPGEEVDPATMQKYVELSEKLFGKGGTLENPTENSYAWDVINGHNIARALFESDIAPFRETLRNEVMNLYLNKGLYGTETAPINDWNAEGKLNLKSGIRAYTKGTASEKEAQDAMTAYLLSLLEHNMDNDSYKVLEQAFNSGIVDIADMFDENFIDQIVNKLGLKGDEETGFRKIWESLFKPDEKVPVPDVTPAEEALTGLATTADESVKTVEGALKRLDGTSVSISASVTFPTIPGYKPIAKMAEGGQVATGEVFVAREAGPELVGTIGHKSTVMNNDQIVAGVAGGVAEGQAEQNELLRQQNAYLRIIAAKSGKVTLTPSSELGRVNKRSEEMRLRAEGV